MKTIIVLMCCLFLTACSGNNDSTKAQSSEQKQAASAAPVVVQQNQKIFSSIPPEQANQLIKNNKNLLILDVRSPQELREGKIAGSTLVPFWQIAKGEYKVPANQPVLLVCAVGGRSYAVGQYLTKSNYPEVYNLKGGMSAWKKAGLPVVY